MCFALMAAFVKAAGVRLPAIQLVWMRCILAIPLVAALIWGCRKPWRPTNKALLVGRSLLGLGAMSLSFYGLTKLELADQLMLSKTGPLWIAVLSPLMLAERAGPGTLAAVAMALIGCALILQPTLAIGNVAGAAVLLAALFSALAHMVLRRLSVTDSSMTIVFWFCVVTCAITTPVVLTIGAWPTPLEWLYLVAVAIAATAGQLFMTHAYAVEEAPVVSASGYTNVLFGVAIGFLIWGEVPGPWTIFGGVLLLGAGLSLIGLRSRGSRPFQHAGTPGAEPRVEPS